MLITIPFQTGQEDEGHEVIQLRPGDKITYEYDASPASSAVANDGAIPYGTTVSSVAVIAFKGDVDATSDLIQQSSESSNIVQVQLKYPATNGGGKYQLRFAITLDNGEIINKRHDNVYAREDES